MEQAEEAKHARGRARQAAPVFFVFRFLKKTKLKIKKVDAEETKDARYEDTDLAVLGQNNSSMRTLDVQQYIAA